MAARDMEAATAQSGTQCGADELKNLLAHITDQIVDADRRHTEVMRQMHDRLAQLGQEARSVRAQAPEQFDDAFDRIEDGMANLAERVAEAGGARKEVPAQAPARAATASAPAPMALRSAGDAPARIEPARPGMDHFGVHDASRPGDAAYPWDEDAAEALMQMHESEGTGYVRRTPDPEFVKPAPVAERAPVIPAAPIAPPIVAPVAPATGSMPGQNDIDKLWLEEQISVLACRLENSIADLRPDNSVQVLGERFNEFEERLAAAFDGVASRADVESISLIEAHIGELAGHLDNVQAQLARLDTIEGQLQAVMGQLSDERLSQVRPAASSLQGASPADLQRVAMNAAEQVANRMQSLVSHLPGADSGTPEFHAILDRFMEDRRLGEEQMVTTLDTMQQALIRVLDRMDVIEMAQYRDPAPASHMAPAYAPELPRYAAPVAPAQAEDHVPAYVAPAATPYVVRAEPPFDAPSRAAPAAPIEAPVDISGMSPVDRIRHDFKADAQRAKQKAAAEASEAAAVKIDSPAKSAARKAGAARKTAGSYAAGTESLFGGKRKLLIGALAIVVLIMGGMHMLRKAKGPAKPSSRIEQSGKPAAKDPKAAASAIVPEGIAPESLGQPEAAAPVTSPAVPNAPPAQKGSVPETVTDDLSLGEDVPDGSVQSGDVVMGLGMTMQSPSSAPLTAELFKIDGGSAATPVALTRTSTAPSAAPGSTTSNLDLPPVTVGPLSFRLAAAKGDPSAEFEVGARMAEGKGTAQNFTEAMRWYQRSATRGFAQAQYRLGTLYERGLGAPMDLGRARVWYQRAAEQGNVKSMHNLAVLSAGRENGTPDYSAAARWFRAAAERGLADSQFNVGVLHESGLGAEKDMKQAYKWFMLAAAGGDKEAARRRELLRPQMAPADIADAEVLAKAFTPITVDPLINDARAAGEDWKKRQSTDANG